MDSYFPVIAVPATVALLFKAAIYFYARSSNTQNFETRLYLLFLFCFSLQNIAEVFGFYNLNIKGLMPYVEAKLFYAATIGGMAFLFHLSVSMVFDDPRRPRKILPKVIYIWATILGALLYFTDWLIRDFEILSYPIGNSVTRVPGPLYFLFALYAIGIFASVIGFSIYGWRKQDTVKKRLKNLMLAAAILPMSLLVFLVLGLLHFGIKWVNWSFTFPMATTYFLIVTAYATHQHRLFDIQYFIPWSKMRKRKTAFYTRIRALIAEIADLATVKEVVNRLSQTLDCPVALIGGPKPVLAIAGESLGIARFPLKELQRIDQIVVANEIAEAKPDVYALMQRHHVAAIVPFHPHSEAAASWMLLGDRFSEEVYSPHDFKMVEQLFDRMGELFLDKLVLMRSQLVETQREMRALHQRLGHAWEELSDTRKENQALREQNAQLLSQYATTVESTVLAPASAAPGAPQSATGEPPAVIEEKALDEYVAEFESRIIEQILKRCEGNKAKAARLLGLRPNTLHYKIERYGLKLERPGPPDKKSRE